MEGRDGFHVAAILVVAPRVGGGWDRVEGAWDMKDFRLSDGPEAADCR